MYHFSCLLITSQCVCLYRTLITYIHMYMLDGIHLKPDPFYQKAGLHFIELYMTQTTARGLKPTRPLEICRTYFNHVADPIQSGR